MTVYDDEVDLRPYLLGILQHWWQIGLVAVGLGVLALLASLAQPRIYQTEATLLLTRSRLNLSLAAQFPTVNDPVDTRARLDAMLSIAQSDALAAQVIQELGDALPREYREVKRLKSIVKISNKGDIIIVSAQARQAELAARLANTWAGLAASQINAAYSGQQPLAEIQGQLKTTREEYETAQTNLEAFIKKNKISLLENKLGVAQSLLARLGEDRAWRIAYYSNRRQSMEDLLVQAQGLQRQLQAGSRSEAGSLGDGLAVLLARAQALGIQLKTVNRPMEDKNQVPPQNQSELGDIPSPEFEFSNEPGATLNLQVGEIGAIRDSPANYAADLDTLISQAENEIQLANEQLVNLAQEVAGDQTGESIETAASQVAALQTGLEAEKARERELTSQRDLSWDAYQAMAEKEAEIRNATQTVNQITLAGAAVLPDRPAARGTVRNTLVGGVFGLILGLAAVLAASWWRGTSRARTAAIQ